MYGRFWVFTEVHLFTEREFSRLADNAGLHIDKHFYIDYETGELRRWSIEGQLFFVLRHECSP